MLISQLPQEKLIFAKEDMSLFNRLESVGIDTSEGVEYAGSEDMYVMALQFFRDTLDAKRQEISDYYDSKDWDNYIAKVHGMKSSARVIGAMELSEHARELELAGQGGDLQFVHGNHQDLMDEMEAFKKTLVGVLE